MHSLILAEAAVQQTTAANLPMGNAQFQTIVLIGFGITWVAMALLGIYFKQCSGRAAVAAPAPTVQPQLQPPVVVAPAPAVTVAPAVDVAALATDEIPAELVAVIAAAVQLTLRDAYRIQAIVPVSGRDWAHEGRRQIFASHQFR